MISHRPAAAGDRNFIVKSWVASFRDADSAGFIKAANWYRVMTPEIVDTLNDRDVTTAVAYETDNPDPQTNAYGFIVADVTEPMALVYYAFVKQPYRRSGIARGLFAAIGVDPVLPFHYVCSTPWCSTLERKIPMARWMPRLGRFPKSERRSKTA